MWIEILKIAVPVAIAILSYAAKYLNDLRLVQRKERLEYIESQLRNLYGPLFALANAGKVAYYQGFRQLYRPGMPMWDPPTNDPTKVTTQEEVRAYHQWMRAVFIPINKQMVKQIIDHTDLLVEQQMPQCILDLLAHVSACEGISSEWDAGNETHHTPKVLFPDQILDYASRHYVALKRQQAKLHGRLGSTGNFSY